LRQSINYRKRITVPAAGRVRHQTKRGRTPIGPPPICADMRW
jgi:hypothetical protein